MKSTIVHAIVVGALLSAVVGPVGASSAPSKETYISPVGTLVDWLFRRR